MKILGDEILARDANGVLKSRIGTLFLRTPGIVTQKGVHAMQRLAWIQELNRIRDEENNPALTEAEIAAEMEQSVDLLFDDHFVLIRPDPYAMDLAFRADECLQTMVSKLKIRYLNTHNTRVRDALRARGENWRMSRMAVSPEEMTEQIRTAMTAIREQVIYYYNHATGTRFLTVRNFERVGTLPPEAFRAQLTEIVHYTSVRNRMGNPEVDVFPPDLALFSRKQFAVLGDATLDDATLRARYDALLAAFEDAVPVILRNETPENIEWRNQLCSALNRQPNTTTADEDLIQGISPEFYRQIEWVPGCRIENGELIFDSLFEEAERTGDAELAALCDRRARVLLFNYLRLSGSIEYINIGRIARSLASRARGELRNRYNVYLVQYKETDRDTEKLRIVRFQKWGVTEHLDENHDLVRAIMESSSYTDYILDRRLACRQLGMNLPHKVTSGQMNDIYRGVNSAYVGTPVWTVYFERAYIQGCATDKIPVARYANPDFCQRFATLLGEAAAIDLIVGRASSDGAVIFDTCYEVLRVDDQGMPERIVITDHTGTFIKYNTPLMDSIAAYAAPVNSRAAVLSDVDAFADAYVAAFRRGFLTVRERYVHQHRAFDMLYKHRTIDTAGSFAYRWQCVLNRLNATDLDALCHALRDAVQKPEKEPNA